MSDSHAVENESDDHRLFLLHDRKDDMILEAD